MSLQLIGQLLYTHCLLILAYTRDVFNLLYFMVLHDTSVVFMILGSSVPNGPFHTKCFFFRLYGTMLTFCHMGTVAVVHPGCSGFRGLMFQVGHMGYFLENGLFHTKCFFSFRLVQCLEFVKLVLW